MAGVTAGLRPLWLLFILMSLIGRSGSAVRPVVTFSPNVGKIFRGDSIEMRCEGGRTAGYYSWYQNGQLLGEKKVTYIIDYATVEHGGNYQCRVTNGLRSEAVTLTVSRGAVILQAPVYVYEGDDVSLRCQSSWAYPPHQTIFYKDNQTVQKSSSDLLTISFKDTKAIYRCSKVLPALSVYKDDTEVADTGHFGGSLVTVAPNWNKIFTGQNLTMTFHGNVPPNGCRWLLNGSVVATGPNYTITSAQANHSGVYQFLTEPSYSTTFRIHVTDGPLILQAPIFSSWRSDFGLICRSRPEFTGHWTTFYKDGKVLSSGITESFISRQILIRGHYACEKDVSVNEYEEYTDEACLHSRELFSKPNLLVTPDQVVEDGNVTLTCHTSLALTREKTRLQFAFFKDGRNIQQFTSDNKYEVWYAWLFHAGNYSCQVRTPTNSVRKESAVVAVHVQEVTPRDTSTTIITLLVVFLLLLTTLISALVASRGLFKPPLPTSTGAKIQRMDSL